jgi:hypothetical protein
MTPDGADLLERRAPPGVPEGAQAPRERTTRYFGLHEVAQRLTLVREDADVHDLGDRHADLRGCAERPGLLLEVLILGALNLDDEAPRRLGEADGVDLAVEPIDDPSTGRGPGGRHSGRPEHGHHNGLCNAELGVPPLDVGFLVVGQIRSQRERRSEDPDRSAERAGVKPRR